MEPQLQDKSSPRKSGFEESNPEPGAGRNRRKRLALVAGCLCVLFALPLMDLIRFALGSSLYSHILLIPFISLYLVRQKGKGLPGEYQPANGVSAILALAGAAAIAGYWVLVVTGRPPQEQDRLALLIAGFVLFFSAITARLFGWKIIRTMTFPLAFLIFMIPMPVLMEHQVETLLQHASADTIYALLRLAGTPVFREGTLFALPGIRLEVAPECCGIHSTLVLLITSLLAGEMLLLRIRTKVALVIGVLLIGILRNAGRVFVLAQIAIHGNPGILDSALHHQGGPIFFVASLLPCFLLIWFLRKLDTRALPRTQPPTAT